MNSPMNENKLDLLKQGLEMSLTVAKKSIETVSDPLDRARQEGKIETLEFVLLMIDLK